MSASLTSGGFRRGTHLLREARALHRVAAAASILAALGLAPAAAETAKTAAHPINVRSTSAHPTAGRDASHPHVYLMRGLLNIFSLGMDQLATQVAQNGIDASVYNHSVEESVVAAIAQKYRGGDHGPYILVGHSLGADAVMLMAQQLDAQGVPVALVVPFDGTASYAAPANVSCVVNLTQRKYAYMQAGAGFHGRLSNVDVSNDTTIDHITIDKSPRLQAIALKEILQAAHGQACRPGQNPPAVARANEPKQPKAIAPEDNATNENPPKPKASETRASPAVAPANHTAPGKSAATPGAAAKTAPAKSATPDKSAAAAARSS
jgi:hypothetical protein